MYRVDISGKGILDDSGINYCLNVELFTSNSTETISSLASSIRSGDAIRFVAAVGKTIVFKHTENVLQLSNGVSFRINGDKGDWIELKKTNRGWQQTAGQTYEPNPTSLTEYIEEISLTGSETVVLFQTRTDKKFYTTKIDFLLLQAQAVKKVPSFNIGFTSPHYNEVVSNFPLTNLKNTDEYMSHLISNVTKVVPPNSRILLKKVALADATKYVIGIRYLGYYL